MDLTYSNEQLNYRSYEEGNTTNGVEGKNGLINSIPLWQFLQNCISPSDQYSRSLLGLYKQSEQTVLHPFRTDMFFLDYDADKTGQTRVEAWSLVVASADLDQYSRSSGSFLEVCLLL